MALHRLLPALVAAFAFFAVTLPAGAQDDRPPPRVEGHEGDSFSQNEIVQAGANFFGTTTEAMAKGVQKIFSDYGLPDAYITGDEGSGALLLGEQRPGRPRSQAQLQVLGIFGQGVFQGFDGHGKSDPEV